MARATPCPNVWAHWLGWSGGTQTGMVLWYSKMRMRTTCTFRVGTCLESCTATVSWCGLRPRSGRVLQVLERGQQEVVGRVEMIGKACWLLPIDARVCPDIFIPPQERLQARRGAMAVAAITRYSLTQDHPQGRIVEVLGAADAPDMEMRLILRKYGLPTAFPPEVEAAAEAVAPHLSPLDLAGRRDLRRLLTFTIAGQM